MAGHRLTQRLDALEAVENARNQGPAAWIIMDEDETKEEAIARYEAEEGPLGDRFAIIWQPVTGAPCHA